MGYGDKYPITSAGRVTATFTVVFGLGVIGTFISVIGGAFLQTHGVKTTIRISRACRERLAMLILEQGKEVSDSNLADTVERIVEDTVSRYVSGG